MPSKKKKYNARFPAGRIKKIMQSDEEVGKVAQAVPVIISRTLELFVESLLTKTLRITNLRNAKTLSPSHMKQCIMSENRFDFLRELVKNIPDISYEETDGNVDNIFYQQQQLMDMPPQQEPFDLRINQSPNNNNLQNNFQFNSTHNGSNIRNADVLRNSRNSHELKRPWESSSCSSTITSSQKLYSPSTSTDSVLQHCTPPPPQQPPLKLQRTNSVTNERISSASTNKHYLQHQPKSVPGSSSGIGSFDQAVLAPIISLDLNNKPTIKIDYSNFLNENQQKIANVNSNNTTTTEIVEQTEAPIINIDLSKIATEPPTINFNLNLTEQKSQQQEQNTSFSRTTTLELDEDYDNI